MLFTNRLEFSWFEDFFARLKLLYSRVWLPSIYASRKTVNSMEQKTRSTIKSKYDKKHKKYGLISRPLLKTEADEFIGL